MPLTFVLVVLLLSLSLTSNAHTLALFVTLRILVPRDAQYYMAISLSVDVRYHLSMAEGGYGTPLRADVQDVVKVTRVALRPLGAAR